MREEAESELECVERLPRKAATKSGLIRGFLKEINYYIYFSPKVTLKV